MVLECLCRQELSSLFTFKDDTSSTRERKKAEVTFSNQEILIVQIKNIFQVIMMPPFIAPKTEVKVTDISNIDPSNITFSSNTQPSRNVW